MRAWSVYLVVFVLAGCALQPTARLTPNGASNSATTLAHDNLNAVLWQQTAQEYQASAWQSFRSAELALLSALQDKKWSAAVEQVGDFAQLPPAVVVDVDETMLDNSAFQARLVKQGGVYSEAAWNAWCNEKAAGVVPGAVEFSQFANNHGVRVFYVSNRDVSVAEVTRENLARWKFADVGDQTTMIFRDKANGMDSKGQRRTLIAKTHRILLLVGDNFGDFHEGYKDSVDKRALLSTKFRGYWGERWIMLPNPSYGSWEHTLFGFDMKLSADAQRAIKLEKLNVTGTR